MSSRYLSPPSRLAVWLALSGAVLFPPVATRAERAGAVHAAPHSGARVVEIDPEAFAGSSVNVIAGLQNTLFTHAGVQYAAFYDADGTLVLAKRELTSERWTIHRTAHKGNVSDAHNTAAIAVDGAGYLHVSWDHHGHPLNYARSAAPGSLELGPRQPMTGVREKRVTYPAFLALPDGDLLFMYRDGSSGRGDLVLNRYDHAVGKWKNQHPSLIDGEGQRSAYVSTTIDAKGRLHLAWVWRDSPDVATNHDLCYARSDDAGATWSDSAGRPIAIPITAASAEYALRIPQKRALMNPPSVAADENGDPFIANYWKPEGSEVPQYHLVWNENGRWETRQITQRKNAFELAGTSTKRPPISRSVLVLRRGERNARRAYLLFRDDEHGGKVMAAECSDLSRGTWWLRELTADSVGAWEPSYDPTAWREHHQLHLLVQNVVQRDGNDREAAAVPPTPISALVWVP